MRVTILSDTHGALDARVLDQVHRSAMAVHAGDIGCAAVLSELRQPGVTVIAVRGNNDVSFKWPREDRVVLDTLPEQQCIDLPGGRLVVVHGHRAGSVSHRHDRLRRIDPLAHAIVYGHSHRLCVDRDARPWVLNPGAAGRSRTYGGPSCIILHATERRWRLEVLRFAPVTGRHR